MLISSRPFPAANWWLMSRYCCKGVVDSDCVTTVLSECFDWALVSGGVNVGGIGVGTVVLSVTDDHNGSDFVSTLGCSESLVGVTTVAKVS